MPFDPKIIRSDERALNPQAELHLPDEFSLLAEQLTDDANRLAACYPPREPEKVVILSRQSSRGGRSVWLVRSLAGGSLAAALLVIGLVGSGWFGLTESEQKMPATANPHSSVKALAAGNSSLIHAGNERILVTPASWLGETSGPELEGIMDLWEREQHEPASVSF